MEDVRKIGGRRVRLRSRNRSFLTSLHVMKKTGSEENTLMLSSSDTMQKYERTGELKEVTVGDGREWIEEIVNNMFDEKVGLYEMSSSRVSSLSRYESIGSMDKRLKQWNAALFTRQNIEQKLQTQTGKRREDLLFNRPATIDARDKQTVQRVLDYAERMNPIALTEKRTAVLRDYIDPETCQYINELQETLPKAEQDGHASVEITGLPKFLKYELVGDAALEKQQDHSKFLNSEVLCQRVNERREDIERVVEYYPDIDNLQVVGVNTLGTPRSEKCENIELLECYSMLSVSSITGPVSDEDNKRVSDFLIMTPKEDIARDCVVVNNEIFTSGELRSAKNVEFDFYFECEPFRYDVKEILCIENRGSKVITCGWEQKGFYKSNPTLHLPLDNCFIFNSKSFILEPGSKRKLRVMFQPRVPMVAKSRWDIKLFPQFFCSSKDSLKVRLHGKCVASDVFIRKNETNQQRVIDKSNKKSINTLAQYHAELAPMIQPHEVLCPYKRIFDEREIFNSLNTGYKCERFDDLELLKKIYDTLKLPREPQWDHRLETIKKSIMRLKQSEQREIIFGDLMHIVDSMTNTQHDLIEKFEHCAERDRSRYIYVRGCISNGIDEWEHLMLSIEANSLKLQMQRFNANMQQEDDDEEEEEEEVMDEPKPWLRKLKYEDPQAYCLKKLRAAKHFRDLLYMQTYTHVCDIVENIVSVIESTEYV